MTKGGAAVTIEPSPRPCCGVSHGPISASAQAPASSISKLCRSDITQPTRRPSAGTPCFAHKTFRSDAAMAVICSAVLTKQRRRAVPLEVERQQRPARRAATPLAIAVAVVGQLEALALGIALEALRLTPGAKGAAVAKARRRGPDRPGAFAARERARA